MQMGNSTDCPVLNSVGREGLDGDDGMGGENRLGIDVCIEVRSNRKSSNG
jgi:hypothetical protein